jgi:hypothetical protein
LLLCFAAAAAVGRCLLSDVDRDGVRALGVVRPRCFFASPMPRLLWVVAGSVTSAATECGRDRGGHLHERFAGPGLELLELGAAPCALNRDGVWLA